MSLYDNCLLCPRRCGVNREAGQTGYCGETAALRLAFAGIHKGEEPPITGAGGSGTIFVSGCNLGCAFCQNHQISQAALGRIADTGTLAEICLSLQEKGAENINIVTGSHAAPALVQGIETARKQGLVIPILWNSSGYDGMESLELLKDIVDVYLPDLKTLDSKIASRFFNAQGTSGSRTDSSNYPEHAAAAILKMMEFRKLRFDDKQTLVSGVMIRHLVLPGLLDNTRQVLRWFADNCKSRALLSLMTQYTPVPEAGAGSKKTGGGWFSGRRAEIPNSYVSSNEYEAVLSMLDEFGIEDGFCQELVTGSDWLPDFTRPNPFSSELSVPVWHWHNPA